MGQATGLLFTVLIGALIGVLVISALCAYVPGFEENVFNKMVDMYPSNHKKKDDKDDK